MTSKLNPSTFPFHISPDQKKWVPDPRSSGNWIINRWYGATVRRTEWLKDIPQAIEEEAQFIHSMLKDPNQLSKMSEADLRLATQEMPNTFDVLNHYRTSPLPPSSLLAKILADYKFREIAQKDLPPPTSPPANVQQQLEKSRKIQACLEDIKICDPGHLQSKKLREITRSWQINQFHLAHHTEVCLDLARSTEQLERSADQIENQALAQDLKTKDTARKHVQTPLEALISSKSHPIDDRLFQHILGDYFGKNTGLEGYLSSDMLSYLAKAMEQQNQALKSFYETDGKETVSLRNKERLSACQLMSKKLQNAVHRTNLFEKNVKEFSKEIERAMNSSETQDSILFMGGWRNEFNTSGHAVVYEIEKQKNGLGVFRIFNRGEGTDYHVHGLMGTKERTLPCLEIVDIPIDRLNDLAFLKALQELKTIPSWGADNSTEKIFYGSLIPILGGKVNHNRQIPEQALEYLDVEHCSYLSLTGVLHWHMGEAYHRSILDLQCKTLWDYYQQIKPHLANNAFLLNQFKQGYRQLARNAEEGLKNKLLSLRESHFLMGLLKEIEQSIAEAEKTVHSEQINLRELQPPSITSIETRKWRVEANREALSKEIPPILDALHYRAHLPTFAQECFEWRNRFIQSNKQETHCLPVKEEMKDWIKNLPTSWLDDSTLLTKTLTPEMAEEIICRLSEIGKEFIYNHVNVYFQNNAVPLYVNPSDLFSIVKLFTLADCIAKSFKDFTGIALPDLYQLDMNLLLNGSSGHVCVFDPELEEQIGSLKTYWDRVEPPEQRKTTGSFSFFGIEVSNVGGYSYREIDAGKKHRPSYPWPDLIWTEKYLSQPAIQEKIRQENPELAKQSIRFQAMAVLHDQIDARIANIDVSSTRAFLPKAFYALRDLSFSIPMTLSPPRFRDDSIFKSQASLQTDEYDNNTFYWRSKLFDFYSQTAKNTEYTISYDQVYNLSGNYQGFTQVDRNRLLQNGQDPIEAPLSFICQQPRWMFPYSTQGASLEPLRCGPHLRTYFPSESLESVIDREKIQDLLSLSGVRDLQIVETIGYFKKHPTLFGKKEYQILFKTLMAEPPLLLEQFKRGGVEFAAELAAFTKENFDRFEKLNDEMASAYFLDLNRYFLSVARHIKLDAPFFDSDKELKKRAKQPETEPQTRSSYWSSLAASISPYQIDEEKAVDLLSAYAFNYIYPLESDHPRFFLSDKTAAENRLYRFQAPLQKILSSENKDLILNAVLQNIFPQSRSYTWKASPAFPFFATSDGAFAINVSTGKIYQQGWQTALLPKELRDTPELQPFIEKGATWTVQKIDTATNSIYQWIMPDGLGIRITTNLLGALILDREIEPEIWAEQISNFFNIKLPQAILEKGNLWEEVSNPSASITFLPNKMSKKNHWISDVSNGKLLYQITPDSILSLDPSRPWKLALPSADSALAQLDEEGYVLIWTDQKTKEPVQIELPRYGLSFQIQDGIISSQEHEGFVLDQTLFHPLAARFSPSVTLKHPSGKTKILFRNPYFSDPAFKNSQRKTFQFDADHSLHPQSGEDRLYLALEQLNAQDYEAAFTSLSTYKSQLHSMSAQECAILERFTEKTNRDQSPSATAIKLRALYLRFHNAIDFNGASVTLFEDFYDQLQRYEQYLDQVPPYLRLSLKEEKWIFFSLAPLPSLKTNDVKMAKAPSILRQRFNSLMKPMHWPPGQPFRMSQPSDWENLEENLTDKSMCFFNCCLREQSYIGTGNEDQSLLRRTGLGHRFHHLYKLIKSQDLKSYRDLSVELIGEQPDSHLSIEELRKQIRTALSIIASSQTEIATRIAALSLLGVLENPEKFSETKGFPYKQLKNQALHELKKLQGKSRFDFLPKKFLEFIWPDEQKPKNLLQKPWVEPDPPQSVSMDAPVLSSELPPLISNDEEHSPSIDFSKWIEEEAIPPLPAKELARLFHQTEKDSLVNQQFLDLSKRLDEFTLAPRKHFTLKDLPGFQNTKNLLRIQADQLHKEIEQLEKKALELANKNHPDLTRQILRQFRHASHFEHPISLQDLILAFSRSNPSMLEQKNPALHSKESQYLMEQTKQILMLSTKYQQQLRIIQRMEAALKLESQGASPTEISLALEEVQTTSNAKRMYQVDEHPEFLVFEHAIDSRLRPSQVESLKKLEAQNGIAMEQIMGSGKTMVLLPLIALQRADGNNLSMLAVPEALLPEVAKTLKNRLGTAFAQSVDVLHFDRNTLFDVSALLRLLDRLEIAKRERKAVLISSSSLQSLVLRFLETISIENKGYLSEIASTLKMPSPSTIQSSLPRLLNVKRKQQEIDLFKQLISAIKQSGALTLDEMDSLLDVLKGHHFTQGRPSKMSEDLLDAVTHTYTTLALNPRVNQMIQWNFLPAKAERPLTKKTYEDLQPVLAEELLKPSKNYDIEINQFLTSLSKTEKENLKDYVLQKKNLAAARFVAKIPSQKIKNTLAVWKEEVSLLLFLTGNKQVDEHYGKNPTGLSEMAIPYAGSDHPVVGSQHGTDLEILHYTIQMQLVHGVSLQTVREEISRLKEAVHEELQWKPALTVEATTGYRDFLRLAGGSTNLSLFSLSDANLEQIREAINRDPELQIELIRRHVLPKLQTYSRELHTSAHIFETLFKQSIGFSGTLWNADSFPRSYVKKEPSDTEVKTLHLLWKDPPSVTTLPQQSLPSQIKALYQTHQGSLADLGGIFRGIAPEAVVKEILRQNPQIKAVASYDDQNLLRVWKQGKQESVPFEQSGLKKEEIIAYWPQKFTTGSDIPLAPEMTAVVTVGKHTLMRDLLQAVWRLRGLDRGQRVSFVLLEEDRTVMQETLKALGRTMQNPPSLSDLLLYVKYHETQRQGDDNLRSVKLKLRNVLIEPLWGLLLDPTKDPKSCKKAVEELFFKTKSPDPYDHYGQIEEMAETRDIIQEDVERLKKGEAFALFSNEQKRLILKELEKILKEEIPHLPRSAMHGAKFETQVEIQHEIEVEKEVEKELEVVHQIEFDRNIPEKSVFLWKEENLFRKNYFLPASSSKQIPNPNRFPKKAAALPDFETLKKVPHPQDHLDLSGKDLLAANGIRPLSHFGHGADPRLLMSWNAIPSQKMPFVLVIEDKTSGAVQLLMLNQWDALMFQKLLQKDRLNPQSGAREHRLALYHLGLGISSQGSEPIDFKALEKNEMFLRIKVQAKFFNGDIEYSDEEFAVLQKWLAQDKLRLKNYFEKEVLKNKPVSAGHYPKSRLGAFLCT